MAVAPNRLENLKTLRAANLDGAFANAFATLVGGAFMVKLLQFFGGSDLWIGAFTAIPALLGLMQIPGAIWGRRKPFYRKFVAPGGWLWRLLYLPLIVIPWLPISDQLKILLLMTCVILASAAVQIVTPIYNEWLAEMIPPTSRGWYFSRRNALAAGIGAAVSMGGSFLFDAFADSNQLKVGFTVIFSLGGMFAITSMYFFMQMTERERANPLELTVSAGLRAMMAPFRDRDFRKVLVFLTFFIFAQAFAGNFYAAYAFEELHMSMRLLSVTAIAHATGNIASIRIWGYLADKYGNKPLLVILGLGIAVTPIQWQMLTPGQDLRNAIILGVGHIFAGMFWGGISVCQFNLLLATAKEEDRANYIGAGLALSSLVGAVSPYLGSEMMHWMRFAYNAERAYFWLFVSTMIMRGLAIIFIAPVRERGALSLRGTLKQLKTLSPHGYLALRKMTRGGTAVSRREAIASAASVHFSIAQSEIIGALHDPSPAVRREAAMALARFGGPESVEALTHMLRDHPDLVDEEVLESLGSLGDEDAAAAIQPYLDSPRPAVRRAAAKALGEIGGSLALASLRVAASRQNDPDLRRAGLQALRMLRADVAGDEIVDALLDPLPSVRIAACEAVSELQLTQAVPKLRESIEAYHDEANSEAAYALGCVGSLDDLEMILLECEQCQSVITSRRCLLGAARLLGVESEVYRLFLLTEMARDTVIYEMTRDLRSQSAQCSEAIGFYASEQEREALARIAEGSSGWLQLFASHPVREGFLVAICKLVRERST